MSRSRSPAGVADSFLVADPKFSVIPAWESPLPIVQTLQAAGFHAYVAFQAHRPDGTLSMSVWEIRALTDNARSTPASLGQPGDRHTRLIPGCTHRIPSCTRRIPTCTRRIQNCTSPIPGCTRRIPSHTSLIPSRTDYIPNRTGLIRDRTRPIPVPTKATRKSLHNLHSMP